MIMGDKLTAQQRRLRARAAAHASWAKTKDRCARTEPARKAALARFEKQVDPDGVLTEQERAGERNTLAGPIFLRWRCVVPRPVEGLSHENEPTPALESAACVVRGIAAWGMKSIGGTSRPVIGNETGATTRFARIARTLTGKAERREASKPARKFASDARCGTSVCRGDARARAVHADVRAPRVRHYYRFRRAARSLGPNPASRSTWRSSSASQPHNWAWTTTSRSRGCGRSKPASGASSG